MDDLRTEIRAAFEIEQRTSPPIANLRRDVAASVAKQPHSPRNLHWLTVAVAAVLGLAVIAGLMSTRLAYRPSIPSATSKPTPFNIDVDYGPPPTGVPLFYVGSPGHPGWYTGFDWNGAPRGTIKLEPSVRARMASQAIAQSPDGTGFAVTVNGKGANAEFLDRLGRPIAGPQTPLSGFIWADDNQHMCGAVAGFAAPGAWTLVTQTPGQSLRSIATVPQSSNSEQAAISVLACSFRNDRAVLARNAYSAPTELWAIQLSTGEVTSHLNFTKGTIGTLTGSADGELVAENSSQAVALPGGSNAAHTNIVRVSEGAVVGTLDPAYGALAFSADGQTALVSTSTWFAGYPTHLAIVDLSGRILWRYDGDQALAGFVTEPSGAAFAVMLQAPRGEQLHASVSVIVAYAYGRAVGIPGRWIKP